MVPKVASAKFPMSAPAAGTRARVRMRALTVGHGSSAAAEGPHAGGRSRASPGTCAQPRVPSLSLRRIKPEPRADALSQPQPQKLASRALRGGARDRGSPRRQARFGSYCKLARALAAGAGRSESQAQGELSPYAEHQHAICRSSTSASVATALSTAPVESQPQGVPALALISVMTLRHWSERK